MAEGDRPNGADRVPTWRDGVVLTREVKADLTAVQWRQYADDSVVRDLSELDQMPEPVRSWGHRVVERARERAGTRIVEQERREAL
jgi:hypothetical protein